MQTITAMMKWIKSSDGLPNSSSEILIKHDGEVSLGYYDRKSDKFVLRNGQAIDYRGRKVFWMELTHPEMDSKKQ
jgi:hypothetical protein